jgi:hypothetical protein
VTAGGRRSLLDLAVVADPDAVDLERALPADPALPDACDNVSTSGSAIPLYGPDYETYFTTKWRQEFRLR